MAAGIKDNINTHDFLVEPEDVIDEPPPKPETVVTGEDAGAADARIQRDQAAIRRINELNVEKGRKGPRKSQNWFYLEAEARLKSRLFFALGKKTVERIKLYNTVFMLDNDTFLSFYARLSAQVALCNWPNAQERETLKDLFIGRIRDVDVQQQFIKAKADLDDTFKIAFECEKGASTSAQFQKLLPHNQHSNAIKVKQEPTFSIQSSRGKRNYPQNQKNRQNWQSNQGNKSCYFCGNPFSPDHRKSCPARKVTCNLCRKRGHFAKCCNS